MQRELFNQMLSLFDTPEKWNAFTEMANNKESIKQHFFSQPRELLVKYFNENPVDGWAFEPWGEPKRDMTWYLTEFGPNSIRLATGWYFEFHLIVKDTNVFDTNLVDELLKSEYSLLLSAFDRIDRLYEDHTKAMEQRNYHFESVNDTNFRNEHLDSFAWYAGNRTKELAGQIIRKVERFRKDPEMTRMLTELNEKSKFKNKVEIS